MPRHYEDLVGGHEESGKCWGSVSSGVRSEDAMNDSFSQEFQPGIQNGMSWNIDRESVATASNQVSNDMTFKVFFCWWLLGLIPGGAPFSQLSNGVKDAMVGFTKKVKCHLVTNNDMTFKERDVGTEINRDGGPGIGERKLGEGDVMVLDSK